jgi:MFS family permease
VRFGALGERNFRLLFIGQTISIYGDRLLPVALAFAVLDLTGRATDLGYVFAAQYVPMVVLVLFAGVVADRLPRQLVMLASDAVRVATQAGMAALLLSGNAHIWELVVLCAVGGAADAFFNPAVVGLIPSTVPPGRLQEANALRGLAFSISAILGPATAGVIVAATSPGWALVFDAATFAVSVVSLALMRIDASAARRETSVRGELRHGFELVRSQRWLWVSISYWGVFNLAGLPVFLVLGPYVAKHSLGGATAWATILTVGGVGSFVGGLVSMRSRPKRPLHACVASTLPWWIAPVLLAERMPTAAIAAAFFVTSITIAYGNTVWTTALQERVPRDAISRVTSFDVLGTYIVSPAGYALVGVLAAAIGVSTTLVVAACGGAAATLVTLALLPA